MCRSSRTSTLRTGSWTWDTRRSGSCGSPQTTSVARVLRLRCPPILGRRPCSSGIRAATGSRPAASRGGWWNPNPTVVYEAPTLRGPWRSAGSPFNHSGGAGAARWSNAANSFRSQPNFVLVYETARGDEAAVWMADRWCPNGDVCARPWCKCLLGASYVWLPVRWSARPPACLAVECVQRWRPAPPLLPAAMDIVRRDSAQPERLPPLPPNIHPCRHHLRRRRHASRSARCGAERTPKIGLLSAAGTRSPARRACSGRPGGQSSGPRWSSGRGQRIASSQRKKPKTTRRRPVRAGAITWFFSTHTLFGVHTLYPKSRVGGTMALTSTAIGRGGSVLMSATPVLVVAAPPARALARPTRREARS